MAPPSSDFTSVGSLVTSEGNFSVRNPCVSEESVVDTGEVSSHRYIAEAIDSDCAAISRPESPHCHHKNCLAGCGSHNSILTSEFITSRRKECSDDECTHCSRCKEQCVGENERLDSSESGWTDAKHRSYLNSIEAEFVKNMYDREYCSVDLCGQEPRHSNSSEQDCVESRPTAVCWVAERTRKFKIWQGGGWLPMVVCRPWLLQCSSFPAPAVLANPWVKHFRSTSDGIRHVRDTSCFPASNTSGLDTSLGHGGIVGESPARVPVDCQQAAQVSQDRLEGYRRLSCFSYIRNKQANFPNIRGISLSIGDTLKQLKKKQLYDKVKCQMHDKQNCLPNCKTDLDNGCVLPLNDRSNLSIDSHLGPRKREVQGIFAERNIKMSRSGKDCCFVNCADQVIPPFCSLKAQEETGYSGMLNDQDHSMPAGSSNNYQNCDDGILDHGELSVIEEMKARE
eukprot:c22709_g1_i3 orf=212-1570(+)